MRHDSSIHTVQRRTEDAIDSVRVTAAAYRDGAPGMAELYAEAERCYNTILADICELTDEEADVVEPVFTKFELEFNALSKAILRTKNPRVRELTPRDVVLTPRHFRPDPSRPALPPFFYATPPSAVFRLQPQ